MPRVACTKHSRPRSTIDTSVSVLRRSFSVRTHSAVATWNFYLCVCLSNLVARRIKYKYKYLSRRCPTLCSRLILSSPHDSLLCTSLRLSRISNRYSYFMCRDVTRKIITYCSTHNANFDRNVLEKWIKNRKYHFHKLWTKKKL